MSRSSPDDFPLSDMYITVALHQLSALSSIYGFEVAVQTALRITQHAWRLLPAGTRQDFDAFTISSFTRIWAVAGEYQDGLPLNCVPFSSHPLFNYFDALTYGFGLGQFIVDAPVPTGYRAIPSILFAPYMQVNHRRYLTTRSRISPIPIWFFQRDAEGDFLGVAIESACEGQVQLLGGEYELVALKPKTTLKMKFNWPNYAPCEKQIRGTVKSPMHTINRLAKLTASSVRNFMQSAQINKIETGLPQRWSDIGTKPGEVSVRDVLLLGIIFVSDGAAMPLLAARELV